MCLYISYYVYICTYGGRGDTKIRSNDHPSPIRLRKKIPTNVITLFYTPSPNQLGNEITA